MFQILKLDQFNHSTTSNKTDKALQIIWYKLAQNFSSQQQSPAFDENTG